MFQRQWFSERSQVGLSEEALLLKKYFETRRYDLAEGVILSHCANHKLYWRRQYKRLFHLRKRKIIEASLGPQPIRLYFSSFWPQMNPQDCQLLDFIRAAVIDKQIEVVASPRNADVALFTCYGDLKGLEESEHSLRLLFLGENVRPSFEYFDISLSSDQSEYCGRNAYLPLWILEIDWFGKQYSDRATYPLSVFTNDRCINRSGRSNDIVYVGNNNEPHRISMLTTLAQEGFKISRFGQQSRPVIDKIELYRNYNISFCPENSYYPGYVTEKLIHSYIAGCKAIYWGCLDDQPFRNHPMIIMAKTNDTKLDLAKRISRELDDLGDSDLQYPRLADHESIIAPYKRALSFLARELSIF